MLAVTMLQALPVYAESLTDVNECSIDLDGFKIGDTDTIDVLAMLGIEPIVTDPIEVDDVRAYFTDAISSASQDLKDQVDDARSQSEAAFSQAAEAVVQASNTILQAKTELDAAGDKIVGDARTAIEQAEEMVEFSENDGSGFSPDEQKERLARASEALELTSVALADANEQLDGVDAEIQEILASLQTTTNTIVEIVNSAQAAIDAAKVLTDALDQNLMQVIGDGENAIISLVDDGEVMTQSITAYVASINAIEQRLNQYGLSLEIGKKQEDEEGLFLDGDDDDGNGLLKGINIEMVLEDPDALEAQLQANLELMIRDKVVGCIQQIPTGQCPQIKMEDVLKIPDIDVKERFAISEGVEASVEEIVTAANASALIACGLGYVMYDVDINLDFSVNIVGFNLDDLLALIFSSLDMLKLDLSGFGDFLSPLLLKIPGNFFGGGLFDDLMLRMNGFALNISTYFQSLTGIDVSEVNIPNIFKYKAAELPPPPPLTITKRKDWIGLDMGKKKRVRIESVAWLEVRAGETSITDINRTQHAFSHYAEAQAQQHVYLFDKKATLASAAVSAYVGLDKVSANFSAQIFGKNWESFNSEPLSQLVMKNQYTGSKKSWTFVSVIIPVGPIPVRLSAGAYAITGIDVEYGLVSMKLYAEARPYAQLSMFASAGIDIIILEVGVRAELVLLNISTPLTGQAALMYSEKGEVYLSLDVTGKAAYTALNGNVSAYAKYYVPAASIPPWKKKQVNKILFQWRGLEGSRIIFSWGADIGHDGVKLRGDALSLSLNGLDRGATREDYALALINYREEVENRLDRSILAAKFDFPSGNNLVLSAESGLEAKEVIDAQTDLYVAELIQLFDSEDPTKMDSDGDGITDAVEEANGMNKNSTDSDSDGLPDGYEFSRSYLSATYPADAGQDYDGDGYTNLQEYLASSDPGSSAITPDNIGIIVLIPIISLLLN